MNCLSGVKCIAWFFFISRYLVQSQRPQNNAFLLSFSLMPSLVPAKRIGVRMKIFDKQHSTVGCKHACSDFAFDWKFDELVTFSWSDGTYNNKTLYFLSITISDVYGRSKRMNSIQFFVVYLIDWMSMHFSSVRA